MTIKKSLNSTEPNGQLLFELIRAGTNAVKKNKDKINALNVFPVPDGDTGTNMALTLQSVIDDIGSNVELDAGKCSKQMAYFALMGARGNSGLILSQLFKGLSESMKDKHVFTSADLAEAFHIASENSYKAIPEPKEGTMLTVFTECALAAKKASKQNSDLAHVLETVTKQAIETVKKTPEMLKVLADADVVDSGGYGIAVLLSGAVDYLTNNSDGSIDIEIPSTSTSNLLRVKGDFLDDIREEIWGYCTVFAIKGDGLNVTNIRKHVSNLGKSTVVAGDDTLVKIHSHMEDPGPLISYGSTLGILSNIDIKNMDEQTGDWVQEQQKDLVPDSNKIKTNISIVAVVSGAGLINLMNSLTDNSTYVVDGNHTKNPSVQELLTAVENTETKNVIILPNNKNILNTANQVKNLSGKKIEIVPTLSVQSGISCLFVFDKSCGLEENTTNMKNILSDIKTGYIYRVNKSIKNKKVSAGRYVGTLGETILVTGATPENALVELLKTECGKGSIATIYVGNKTNVVEINELNDLLTETLDSLDFEIIVGGQPNYDYLIGIE